MQPLTAINGHVLQQTHRDNLKCDKEASFYIELQTKVDLFNEMLLQHS